MFDVGFSEMLVIGIVALVVIGPERLPKVARTIGHLMGRAQRYVNDVKRDIDREMQVEELRKLQTEMQETARSIESSVTSQVGEVKSELDKAQDTLNKFAEQTNDLTRLDDPLAATSHTQAAATEAGMDSAAAADVAVAESVSSGGAASAGPSLPIEQNELPQPLQVVQQSVQSSGQQPVAHVGESASQHTLTEAQPGRQQQPLGVQSEQPIAQEQPVESVQQAESDQQYANQEQQTTEPQRNRLRHQVDHIVPDYSEGIMGPNTTISQTAPGEAASGGSSGAAGVAARNVLVHVDVPPVT